MHVRLSHYSVFSTLRTSTKVYNVISQLKPSSHGTCITWRHLVIWNNWRSSANVLTREYDLICKMMNLKTFHQNTLPYLQNMITVQNLHLSDLRLYLKNISIYFFPHASFQVKNFKRLHWPWHWLYMRVLTAWWGKQGANVVMRHLDKGSVTWHYKGSKQWSFEWQWSRSMNEIEELGFCIDVVEWRCC